MRKYDLFIEHVPNSRHGEIGLVYEATLELDDDLEEIVKSGGLKPYLDFHWSQLGIKKQWETVGRKPKVGSLKVLAVKAKGV